MKGQRLIAFVSDGFTNYDREGSSDRSKFEQVIGRLARSGVIVYSLYAMGLIGRPHPLSTGVPSKVSQDTLRDMADETGGRAYINTNDIGGSLQKMIEGNSVYYTLAYYPPKGADDYKFRKITVRLKEHTDYSVRAQRGYMPTKSAPETAAATPQEKLFKAMLSPLPATTIDVTSSADYLEREGDDAQVTLRIHIDGGALAFKQREKEHLLQCELVFIVLDQTGKIATNSAEKYEAALTPEQYEQAKRSGFRYNTRLSMKPGLYQVRVGVREVGSELLGTSTSWVEVPDLNKRKLALSSLFLGQGSTDTPAPALEGGQKRNGQPKLIIGPAFFKPGDSVFYRFVAYNVSGEAQAGTDNMVKVEIMQGEKAVFTSAWQPLNSLAIRRDKRGTEAGGQLKLNLTSGRYLLRVTVKGSKAKKAVAQTADFEIGS